MSEQESVFNVLSGVEVGNKVRQKGKFYYVSWSNAVRVMLKNYPEANWTFTSFEGLPYLETKAGAFVECTVTISGIARTQMMPILDFKNQSVKEPDSMQINKSQMRALTKAIALHGFGLDLWAGEDLDDAEEREEEMQEERLRKAKKDAEIKELERNEWVDKQINAMSDCSVLNELKNVYSSCVRVAKKNNDEKAVKVFTKAKNEAKAKLEEVES